MHVDSQHAVDLLEGVPLFASLSGEELGSIAELTRTERVPPGHVLARPGDVDRSLHLVVEGELQVTYPPGSTAAEEVRLGPGDFFGELGLLNGLPRRKTVKAMLPTEILIVPREDFHELVRSSPGLALSLLSALSLRVQDADQQISDLSDQALRDSLTGLLNRRSFEERLAAECDRVQRYGEPFSLVVLDLDHFKRVNDSFGHATGDQVLAWAGRLISEHTRSSDSAYRIGGEEFAIICPSSEGEVAAHAAKRIVDVMAASRPPLDFDLRVTISAGYAAAPTDARRPDTLFHVADRALLRAKAQGRNRVCAPDNGF